jgi:hypothetical protein
MIRKMLTLFEVLILLANFLFASSSTHAATFSDPPVDLSTLQQTCSIIQVNLHGNAHTINCRQAKSSSKIALQISRDTYCNTPGDNMNVFNYNWTALLCFYGTGYMGVTIYSVNEVDDIPGGQTNIPYPDWFRAYPSTGGEYVEQNPGDKSTFGSTGVLVTQLCIGSNVGGHC